MPGVCILGRSGCCSSTGGIARLGDRSTAEPILQASALGRIDDWAAKPWGPGDEFFHRAISGFLNEWARLHRPRFEVFRVVGEQWAPRSHEIRDLLGRNGIPFGFYPVDSQQGRALLERVGVTGEQLPVVVVVLFDGRVLVDGAGRELGLVLPRQTILISQQLDPDAIGPSAAHQANCSVLVLALSTGPCGLDSNQDRGHPQPGMDLSLAKGGPRRVDRAEHKRRRGPGGARMRVMLMIKGDPEPGAAPSEELLAAMGRYNDELKTAGVLLDLAGLLPSAEGRRVKFSGGDRTVLDGPFPESKQLIAGYWILQVSSMDEAVEWAKRAPFEALSRIYPGEYGATGEIEIRRVFELEGFEASS
jgi:hypothetical protein